jgi:hypothetical protein
MANDKQVFVLIFMDQDGHSAEVFGNQAAARDRVAEIIFGEMIEERLDHETQLALRPVFRIDNPAVMAEEYERLRRELRIGDESERMVVVRAPVRG